MLLVRRKENGHPELGKLSSALSASSVGIQIPPEIFEIEEKDSALAWEWRVATRWAFTECLKTGFVVHDFLRAQSSPRLGTYLLEKGSISGT
jgi:predicted GNAT superfamily acetyltransferase